MKINTKLPLSLLAILLSFMMSTNAVASDPPAPAATADKPKASAAASSTSDDDMSKALLNKMNKGSGDIVIRTGDLPSGAATTEPKAEAKPKVVKVIPAKVLKEEPHHDIHWSYIDGPGGPENWGNLSKDNLACLKGKTQSPININIDRAVKAELAPLEFLYRPSQLSILDNGHTIMVKAVI
jgi:carbonic anhydrase